MSDSVQSLKNISLKKNEKRDEGHSKQGSLIALVILIGILIIFHFFINNNGQRFVKGAKTESAKQGKQQEERLQKAKENLQRGVENRLNSIKEQVEKLKPEDIVTSSPQVQKIIEDLKGLQGVPKNELKNVCESICKQI